MDQLTALAFVTFCIFLTYLVGYHTDRKKTSETKEMQTR